MSEHTSGPWAAERVGTSVGHAWKIKPIGGCIYVDTYGGVCRNDADGAEADACLVTASPDLLAACEAALELMHNSFIKPNPPRAVDDATAVAMQLDTAIKLAKEGANG